MEMRWRYIVLYLLVIGSYAFVTLTAPVTGNTFNLSRFTIGMLQMTLIVPIIFIWYLGVTGASSLKRYVRSMDTSQERRALGFVANGILVLVTGLIVVSLVGTARPYALENGWSELFQITSNYLSVAFPLVGMYLVYRGSSRLLDDAEVGTANRKHQAWLVAFLCVAFVALVGLMFTNDYRNATPDPSQHPSFYLSDALIIGTLLVPYLIVWLFGGLAALNIRLYGRSNRAGTSQAGFRRLGTGIFTIIGSLIFIQVLSLLGGLLSGLGLAPLLLIIYALLIVYGAGYYFIASGARQLPISPNRETS